MEEIKVMTPDDLENILEFEMSFIKGDGLEREMQSWDARWRREALEHYLPLGWSFNIRHEGKMKGYVLCQPVLFYQGWTQTLWIEHVCAETKELGRDLLEIAYKWSRDKHLQKVFLNKDINYFDTIDFAKKNEAGDLVYFNTTKV